MQGIRIAYDAKRAFSNRRGLGNYSRDVIRLAQSYAPENEYVLFGQPTALYTPTGVEVISPNGLWRLCPGLWRSFGSLNYLDGVDLYHGLSGELPFGIHRSCVKTVVTIHDLLVFRYPNLYSPGYRRLFAAKMRYAARTADCIIAISEQTKRDIITYLHADEQKIRVVYQGCNNIYREPVTPQKKTQVRSAYSLPESYILYVGALEERKNLHALVKALAIGRIELPLVLVGAPSAYGEKLKAQASQSGIRLVMLHHVPQVDLPALYQCAEVFTYPSVFEGFGIPILEAMCAGTSVLTSTGSCFAEVGGEAALYADPAKPEEIASHLTKILSNPVLRDQMVNRGYEQAEKFTDEKVAQNLLTVYHELCAF